MTTVSDAGILHLPSRPETVVWGQLSVDRPPVARVRSGETLRIDTVSQTGLRGVGDPAAFLTGHGVAAADVLQDALDIYREVTPPEHGGHVLTGPVWVEGARPGDVLEVRVLAVQPRTPYGVNRAGPGTGALPHLLGEPAWKVIPLDLERNVARFAPGIEVPLRPFMGVIAVAPPPSLGYVPSRPPGVYGGNLDLNELGAGATLYLPVHREGALLLTGDGHAVQGDGEVTGTAIETSITVTLQLLLHQDRTLTMPRAETPTHYITFGMDESLDRALPAAIEETVRFLGREKGLGAADAYALASIAVDFEIAEAVNHVKVVHGLIPKAIFAENPPYWATGGAAGG